MTMGVAMAASLWGQIDATFPWDNRYLFIREGTRAPFGGHGKGTRGGLEKMVGIV